MKFEDFFPKTFFAVTDNLAILLATDIQYIGYKGLRQVYLYRIHKYMGCFVLNTMATFSSTDKS